MDEGDLFLSGVGGSFSLVIDEAEEPGQDGLQWLYCRCLCEVDAFLARFSLTVTRQEFEDFEADLRRLSGGIATDVELGNMEQDFLLILSVRRTGAVTVSGRLTPGQRGTLDFRFDSDLASVDSASQRIHAALTRLTRVTR